MLLFFHPFFVLKRNRKSLTEITEIAAMTNLKIFVPKKKLFGKSLEKYNFYRKFLQKNKTFYP